MQLNKYEQALYYDIFNQDEYWFLKDYILNSNIIFDVWAHFWFFSLYCLQIKKDLEIHCFEPINEFLQKAEQTLSSYSNIVFNNQWISSQSWKQAIFLNKEKTMQTSLLNLNFLNNSQDSVLCDFTTLQDYISINNINQIDILKFDVEWAEFDILLGLPLDLFPKIKVLFFEYHILWDDFSGKYKILLDKIKQIYKNVNIRQSKYTDKIWYILCS